jgi:hypothetical protein
VSILHFANYEKILTKKLEARITRLELFYSMLSISSAGGFMSSFTKRLSTFVLSVVVLSACFQAPPPEAQPELPVSDETPLFTDTAIDNASEDLGVSDSLEGIDDPNQPPTDEAIQGATAGEGDLTTQAVLTGAKGLVVYIWNNPADATRPWRIYRHNEVTDVNTFIYGGLRPMTSVAVSGDGNTLLVSMKETTDAASDYEVFQIAVSPAAVT